ncbi:MAG: OmpA family protein [Leucothrix sp.]
MCLVLGVMASVQAKERTISGIVVDADSRAGLDEVTVELLKDGFSEQKVVINSDELFVIEYDFDEESRYQLAFNKADYYKSEVDLSSALAGGQLPEEMTISLSGEESSFIFWGTSLDRETGEPISNALITKTNRMTGEQSQIQSNIDGRYSLTITSGYDYDVVVQTSAHLKRFSRINYCNEKLRELDKYCFFGFNDVTLNEKGSVSGASILMDKIELGKKFKVDNIYYDSNKATIPQQVLPNLRKLLYTLLDNPKIIVELGSHADSRGSDEYNLALSQRRADAAVDYVVSQGIDRERIRSKGYGETLLVNHCSNGVKCSNAQHEENRRTEFVIVGIDETHMAKK